MQAFSQVQTAIAEDMKSILRFSTPVVCIGNHPGASNLQLPTMKLLREQDLWPAEKLTSYRSLVDIRENMAVSEFPTFEKFKCGHRSCTIKSMETPRQVARLIYSKINNILDNMTYEITFDPAEENGMILGFT